MRPQLARLVFAWLFGVLVLMGQRFEGSAGAAEAQAASQPRPWLGVELGRDAAGQVVALHVVAHSPAMAAGLRDGDVLRHLDGLPLESPRSLVDRIASSAPGRVHVLDLTRGAELRSVQVTLGAFPGHSNLLKLDKIGTVAPGWSHLEAVSGAVPAELHAWLGKVVLLDFWATWCGPCRLASPKLSEWQLRWGPAGLQVLGVTGDEAAVAAQGALALDMRYPVASDPEDELSKRYGVRALPTFFIVDKKGVIRDVVVGWSPSESARVEAVLATLLEEAPVDGHAPRP